jgi:putative ABC transport system ATP-binding protein
MVGMLQVTDLNKSFDATGTHRRIALCGVNLSLGGGEWVTLLGENGSGKSTLFRLITGEERPDSGEIILNGTKASQLPPYRRSAMVTHIHQSREEGIPKAMTVEEVMRLAVERNVCADGKGRRIDLEVRARLESVREGFSSNASQQVWHLSGGEHQLLSLAVAAALAGSNAVNRHLLLLDEHVSQLDPIARDEVMNSTESLIRGSGMNAIMATHDCGLASHYGDRQIILGKGRIVIDLKGQDRITNESELRSILLQFGRQS